MQPMLKILLIDYKFCQSFLLLQSWLKNTLLISYFQKLAYCYVIFCGIFLQIHLQRKI